VIKVVGIKLVGIRNKTFKALIGRHWDSCYCNMANGRA
jgi:hypothetical protein